MTQYIVKRILSAIPTMIGVFIVVFFVVRLLPGDPAILMLGKNASNEALELYRASHGLNESLPVQLLIALKNLATGNMGTSLGYSKPVMEVIWQALPGTFELAVIGIAISSLIAIIMGIIAACNRGSLVDIFVNILSTCGMALPTFYIGLWVLVIFSGKLGIIPILSNQSGIPHWKTMLGPVITMVLGQSLARTTRSAMLEILDEEYIRTARAKGVSERLVIFKHVLGNAMIPIITMIGYNLAIAFGGAIVLETVFVRNGVGKLLIDAIGNRDYPMIQGATVVIAFFMILTNLLTDIAAAMADPRIRVSGDRS